MAFFINNAYFCLQTFNVMLTKKEKAARCFANTFNCSQAVLTAFGQDYNLSEDQCLKIGTAFGGGMARRQMTCGAVTGALMALGLEFGRSAGDPASTTLETYDKTREFFEEFKQRNGSLNCRELLHGHDMNDPANFAKIKESGLFQTVCAKCVVDAVEITEQLISKRQD